MGFETAPSGKHETNQVEQLKQSLDRLKALVSSAYEDSDQAIPPDSQSYWDNIGEALDETRKEDTERLTEVRDEIAQEAGFHMNSFVDDTLKEKREALQVLIDELKKE